ncbi:hypothetical protein [Geothrix campi]|uniref:hypothetical protein n=1 Tax=Geothrix campi TaxID=2966450 RepID=UPI0021486136|nr:hypothetical protein [Geothrix sp. SG10]
MRIRFLIVFLVLSLAGLIQARETLIKAEDVKEVTISFMPWKTQTNRRLSAEDIRSNPNYRFSVRMPWDIKALLKHLPLQELKPTTDEPGDTRLVIDFQLANGSRMTLHASQFYLYTEDCTFRWRVTPKFKRFFRFEEMSLLK